MLFANNASEPPANPLHMYIYDSDYNIKDTLLPQRLRDVVKRCMLQTNDLAHGDVAFIIVDAKAKSGKKYSALKLSLNYIYKMPLPRELFALGMVSPTSSASTAPVKSPQPMQSTERASKVTKINFD
jgi:hypothetical protein